MNLDDYIEGTFNSDHPANQKELERNLDDVLGDLSKEDGVIVSEAISNAMALEYQQLNRTLFWRNSMRRLLELQDYPLKLTSDEQQELNKLKTDLKQILGL